MKRPHLLILLASTSLAAGVPAQAVPASLTGTWKIVKRYNTHNPQCWDDDQAKALLNTTLSYQAKIVTWKGGAVPINDALTRTLSRRKYQDEYKVDLAEFGIAAATVTEIDLQHEDADITGATTEVPGDTVVLAGPGRIVVSACGVFYSAVRVPGGKPPVAGKPAR